MTVESWLGRCTACGDHEEAVRAVELRQAEAQARLMEVEASRQEKRLSRKPPLLDDPIDRREPLEVHVSSAKDE